MRRAVLILFLVVVAGGGLILLFSPTAEFMLGGAMINIGYRLQDRLTNYDFIHDDSITPSEVWAEIKRQNELAAEVRDYFPRTVRHPVVAVVACMDARIDTNELVGDTRRYYYVVRTAGSVLSTAAQDMLELAVLNGVKVVLLTTHTDCAAEKAAADPVLHDRFPAMTTLVEARDRGIEEFKVRPYIKEAVAEGRLEIHEARIDTDTDRLIPTSGD